jgi:hypothetical protein
LKTRKQYWLGDINWRSIAQNSYDLIKKSEDKINNENIIVIEKPSSDSDLFNLNKILN